jgi:hypothetical protein
MMDKVGPVKGQYSLQWRMYFSGIMIGLWVLLCMQLLAGITGVIREALIFLEGIAIGGMLQLKTAKLVELVLGMVLW